MKMKRMELEGIPVFDVTEHRFCSLNIRNLKPHIN